MHLSPKYILPNDGVMSCKDLLKETVEFSNFCPIQIKCFTLMTAEVELMALYTIKYTARD